MARPEVANTSRCNKSLVPALVTWLTIVYLGITSKESPWLIRAKRTQPIQLVEINDDTMKVNDDALYNLMKRDELQGRHLMILSIAGEIRAGKSFIMNFFARYLRYRGWENPDWIGEETEIGEDFNWASGSEIGTQGMLACPEIFHVPLEDGSEAAVILVDTQGLYGGSTSTNVKLMTLSAVLSSYEIVNTRPHNGEKHLETLQLFTELAKATTNHRQEMPTRLCQALLFLIRDWDWVDKYQFGDSTSGYLAELLKEESPPKTVHEPKESIRDAFDKIGCYLLPYPGEKVEHSAGHLTTGDVDKKFIQTTKNLVESILHPQNLDLKRNLKNQSASASDILHMIGIVGKNLKDSKIQEVLTLRESIKEGNLIKELIQAVFMYKAKMEEQCDDIISDEQLRTHHEKILSDAIEHFKMELATESDKTIANQFLNHLKEQCDDVFTAIQKKNSYKKIELMLMKLPLAQKFCKEFVKKYKKGSKALISTKYTVEKFKLDHKKFKQTAISSFDEEFSDVTEIFPFVKEGLIRKVDLEFAKAYISARLFTDSNMTEATKRMLMLIQEFLRETDQYSSVYIEDIETLVVSIKRRTMKIYDGEATENNKKTLEKNTKEALNNTLDELSKQLVKRNQANMDKIIKKCEIIGMRYAQLFEKHFEEIMMETYIVPSALENQLNAFLSQATDNKSFRDLPVLGQEIVLKDIKEKIKSLNSRNEQNKKFRSVFITLTGAVWEKLLKFGALTEEVYMGFPF